MPQPLPALADMTPTQWEGLCDGCAKCCMHKLIDEETGDILYTNVACRLLDLKTGRCKDYAARHCSQTECVELTPQSIVDLHWMPETCAYRLVAAGRPLPDWHPLLTGNRHSTDNAGMSMRGRMISEDDAGPLEEHVVFVQKPTDASGPGQTRRKDSVHCRYKYCRRDPG